MQPVFDGERTKPHHTENRDGEHLKLAQLTCCIGYFGVWQFVFLEA